MTIAHGGAVDVGRIDVGALFLQDVAVGLDEQLDRLADALAEDGRELRLPLAAVEDRLQERGRARPSPAVSRGPGRGGSAGRRPAAESAPSSNQRSASHSHQASKSRPAKISRHWRPLVRSGEALAAPAEPLDDLARGPAAAADAEAGLVVDEDGEDGAGCGRARAGGA